MYLWDLLVQSWISWLFMYIIDQAVVPCCCWLNFKGYIIWEVEYGRVLCRPLWCCNYHWHLWCTSADFMTTILVVLMTACEVINLTIIFKFIMHHRTLCPMMQLCCDNMTIPFSHALVGIGKICWPWLSHHMQISVACCVPTAGWHKAAKEKLQMRIANCSSSFVRTH